MKLLFFVPIFYCTQLFAQTKIGIVGGLNFAWQHLKSTSSNVSGEVRYDMITSFHAGLVSEFKISDRLGFHPAILFTGKGSRISASGMGSGPGTREIKLYYIEVPLVVNYNFAIGKDKIFVGAGPYLSYGLSGKDKHSSVDVYLNYDAFEYLFNRFDAGLKTQIGYRRKNFQLSATLSLGFVNIYDQDRPQTSPETDVVWKNHMLGFSMAYFFNLKD